MTLIEVLIASLILFIAVSVMSFVARSSSLNEQRLIKNIERSVLSEYIKDSVSYYYQYENSNEGVYKLGTKEFNWRVEIIQSKPAMRAISSESSEQDSRDGVIILYQVIVTPVGEKKAILSFKNVYWKS